MAQRKGSRGGEEREIAAKGAKGDAGRNELIRLGGTLSTLSQIFDVDPDALKRIVAKHQIPCVVSGYGQELYSIRAIAPYVIDITKVIDIEAVLKSTSLKKLPPDLTKNFWDAYNSRKKALEDDKRLWRTEAVLEVFMDVFKAMNQSINRFNDTLADRTETSEAQRRFWTEMTDGLRATLRQDLIEQFELYSPLEAERYEGEQDAI